MIEDMEFLAVRSVLKLRHDVRKHWCGTCPNCQRVSQRLNEHGMYVRAGGVIVKRRKKADDE